MNKKIEDLKGILSMSIKLTDAINKKRAASGKEAIQSETYQLEKDALTELESDAPDMIKVRLLVAEIQLLSQKMLLKQPDKDYPSGGVILGNEGDCPMVRPFTA